MRSSLEANTVNNYARVFAKLVYLSKFERVLFTIYILRWAVKSE